jgi:hypothetical protein
MKFTQVNEELLCGVGWHNLLVHVSNMVEDQFETDEKKSYARTNIPVRSSTTSQA